MVSLFWLLTSVSSTWLDIDQVLFFCVFMDRDGVKVHKLAKKNEANIYPAILTEKAWSIKDLLFCFRGNFSREKQQMVLSGQDSFILPAQVANHNARFGSSCPSHGASHTITVRKDVWNHYVRYFAIKRLSLDKKQAVRQAALSCKPYDSTFGQYC